MTDQTTTPQTGIQRVNEYFGNEVVRSQISSVLGERNTGPYIASVLLAVANSPKLQECTPKSIYFSALQAATLRLSVDPSTGQAYLVPFNDSKSGTVKATLIVGYRGLYHMAIRTGRYRYVNVAKIYQGETCEEDRLTGLHKLGGQRTGDKVIGYIGAFEMIGGFAHTLYMSVDDIHAHARKYSKGYDDPKGKWKTSPEAMEHKTVMRIILSKWGYLDPVDAQALEIIEDSSRGEELEELTDGNTVEGSFTEDYDNTQPHRGEADINRALGFM